MSIPESITRQLLPKPPRLSPSGQGYDWREFDRWLQRLFLLLGPPSNPQTFNITSVSPLQEPTEDQQTLLDFIPDHQQEIRDLAQKVDSLAVLISFERSNEQRLNDIEQLAKDAQTLYWMES